MPPSIPDIESTEKYGFNWITFPNKIDIYNEILTKDKMVSLLKNNAQKVVLDFSLIEWALSPHINILIRMTDSVADACGEIYIVNCTEKVYNLFLDLKLDKRIPIYKDEEEFKLEVVKE